MVSSLSAVEAFLRVIGLPYSRRGDALLVEYEHRGERIGIVIELDSGSGYLRAYIPTDVEPTEEGLRWLLSENFAAPGRSYGLDYDGFIVVVAEAPARCVENARDLRELLLQAIDGYKKLMERVEEG